MSDSTKGEVLAELERLIGEVDGLLRTGLGRAGEGMQDAKERTDAILGQAREKLAELEKELEAQIHKRAQHADRYVHERPWVAIGVSAAVAFLLGCLATRRKSGR